MLYGWILLNPVTEMDSVHWWTIHSVALAWIYLTSNNAVDVVEAVHGLSVSTILRRRGPKVF
jgi:hypothetical protein